MKPPNTLNSPKNHRPLLYEDLTSEIRKAAYSVHNSLGFGFLEKVYENALAHEFEIRKIKFESQALINVYYKDIIAGQYYADLLVEDKVIIELKAVAEIDNNHIAQTLNYLKGSKMKLGIVINFGAKQLQFKRIVL